MARLTFYLSILCYSFAAQMAAMEPYNGSPKNTMSAEQLEKNLKAIHGNLTDTAVGTHEGMSNCIHHRLIRGRLKKLFKEENPKPTYTFDSSSHKIGELAWSTDEQMLAMSLFTNDASTNKIAIVSISNLRIKEEMLHPNYLTYLTFNSTNSHLAAANEKGLLYIWKLGFNQVPPKVINWAQGKIISQLAFNEKGDQITALCHAIDHLHSEFRAKENESSLITFDLESGNIIKKLCENSNVLRFNIDGNLLRIAQKKSGKEPLPTSWDSIIDLETGNEKPTDTKQSRHLSAAHTTHHPDGIHRITRDRHAISLTDNKKTVSFACNLFPYGNALFSPNGSFLALGGYCTKKKNQEFDTLIEKQNVLHIYDLPSI